MTKAIIYLEIEKDEADTVDFINYVQELIYDRSLDIVILDEEEAE